MELSVIVVNYNVRYFLHICLESLLAATSTLKSEIIVVDNASVDGSVDMIRELFPSIRLISNPENVGFGKACNQGLQISRGRHVLFVNPDSLMGESLLTRALEVFTQDETIGAVGVCLLDGNGQVLRESKRSIPTLWSAFTKFSGLSDLFPRSPFFNGYYAPELAYDETGDIEVLPGAFMLIRKDILDDLGGFDPRFFMYAEDIDLSYRITRAGYRIRYLGTEYVIHFKGESTQKSLKTYTNTFFHSMRLFIRKYKGELYAPGVAWLLQGVVRTIQGIQSFRKRIFKANSGQVKSRFPTRIFLLTGRNHIRQQLLDSFDFQTIELIPQEGAHQASFYLRYAPSWLQTHPDTAMILDFRALHFEQIVDLWKIPRRQPIFMLDGTNSFIICSHNKEKQGEVHTFTP